MKSDVTTVLVDEHRLILRMIAQVEARAARLEATGELGDGAFFLDAVDFIRTFADRFHHAKEEDVLFRELIENGMPRENSPVAAMLLGHEQGRDFVRGLEQGVRRALSGVPGEVPAIVANARGYAALLRDHIEKEDQILYPLAERILPEAVRPRMLTGYAAAAERTPGLLDRYRRLVERYEAQLAA